MNQSKISHFQKIIYKKIIKEQQVSKKERKKEIMIQLLVLMKEKLLKSQVEAVAQTLIQNKIKKDSLMINLLLIQHKANSFPRNSPCLI